MLITTANSRAWSSGWLDYRFAVELPMEWAHLAGQPRQPQLCVNGNHLERLAELEAKDRMTLWITPKTGGLCEDEFCAR